MTTKPNDPDATLRRLSAEVTMLRASLRAERDGREMRCQERDEAMAALAEADGLLAECLHHVAIACNGLPSNDHVAAARDLYRRANAHLAGRAKGEFEARQQRTNHPGAEAGIEGER